MIADGINYMDAVLAERGKQHGDFTDHARCTQIMKSVARGGPSWPSMSHCQREAIEMIMHKIGRIVCGNPNHKDHWDDIMGYAKLVSDRIEAPAHG